VAVLVVRLVWPYACLTATLGAPARIASTARPVDTFDAGQRGLVAMLVSSAALGLLALDSGPLKSVICSGFWARHSMCGHLGI